MRSHPSAPKGKMHNGMKSKGGKGKFGKGKGKGKIGKGKGKDVTTPA